MARSGPLLTEAQWKKIAPLLPKPPKQRKGGRPWIENRRVLEGILWILRSGARWQDLPEKFPHPSTCWRRLRDWEERGVWLNIWRTFLSELNERQQVKWSEAFLDGSFAPGALAAARNRTDLPAQEESRPSGHPGRTSLATLPAAMDRGTHSCLAGKLPTLGCTLRPFAHDLWCLFSYRLLHDRLTEGCAIASSMYKI